MRACVRRWRLIDLNVRLSGKRVSGETAAIRAGPDVLSIITVLPDHAVAFQLVSTFIGHKGVDTHVAHLVIGPPGEDPEIHTEDRPRGFLDPAYDPRSCVYEYIHVLMEHLGEARPRADDRRPRQRVQGARARAALNGARPHRHGRRSLAC
jgi:hypothetical protein